MTVELHRPLPIRHIPALGVSITVEATQPECAALAVRMGLPEVLALTCQFDLHPESESTIRARGCLQAKVVQTCVISMEDFPADVEETFSVRFVPAGTERDDPDPEDDDEIPYENGVLDLGEAAAEQLGLALDPYPRAPGAALPEGEDDADAGPFAALGRLRGTN